MLTSYIYSTCLHVHQNVLFIIFCFQDSASRDAALRYYKKRSETLTRKLKELKWTDENVIKYLGCKFNKPQLQFTKMQLYNCGKRVHGRRYNSEQKNMTLAIMKQGPKNYASMRRMFIMPGVSTLGRHSAYLMFHCGIDSKLLDFIKRRVADLQEIDKYCILIWDEVALTPHIQYNAPRDIIDGFVELDNVRRPTFATHSLTFMVRGINTPYKQPIAFFYTDGLKAFELVELIKLTGGAAFDTGNN